MDHDSNDTFNRERSLNSAPVAKSDLQDSPGRLVAFMAGVVGLALGVALSAAAVASIAGGLGLNLSLYSSFQSGFGVYVLMWMFANAIRRGTGTA